jgi:hypothetical protein
MSKTKKVGFALFLIAGLMYFIGIATRKGETKETRTEVFPNVNNIEMSFNDDSPSLSKAWEQLASLKFEIYFSDEKNDVVFEPIFTEELIELERQTVILEGYFYDNSQKDSIIMFSYLKESKLPQCCGSLGGAQDYVQLKKNKNLKIKDDKLYKLKGKLKLNTSDDLELLPYFLLDVICLNCNE